MSCVHYKFKSAVNVETITFDGMHISVADLKKAIIQQKKMGKLMENFDLQLSKPQSFDVYKDTDLIPKNSSVIVARIPVERTNKSRSWDPSRIDMSTALSSQKAEANAQEKLQKSADLVNMKGSEEEKVKLMMLQSGKEYSQANYIKPRYPTGPPPRNYVCHRCGQPGHFINACPNRDDGDMTHRLKRSTGIPNSFMTPVVDPNVPGVLMTNTGQLAVPKIDAIAYLQGKKEKPPFVKSDSPERKQDEKIIPGELLCPVCKDLLMDAVVAPCCGNSACDECIRDALIDSDEHVCPICKESGISPDALIPNKFMRTAVNNFQNETGYTTIKRRNQLEISQPPPAPPAAASKPEAERQSIALPPHLVGMPPQVIKAELASKEIHGLGTPSPGLQHARDASFSLESGSAAQAILGGYAIQRTGMTPRLQTVVRSAPYSVVHRQSPAVGSDIIMSHTPTNLVQMSQGKHGDSPHAPPGAYLDERGILHQTPHARPRLMHPSVRQWPHGPGLRGSILIPGRGGHRMTVLRPSSVGTRRLGLLPPPGESHFSASVPEHGFPPSAAVGLVSHNPIPGPLPPQGMPGRVPQQQPPSQVAPGMIRIPAPPHPSGPPQQIIYSRLPPPAGPGSRLMGQEMIITPPQGFIPPLMPTANANLPPPVPLTEEEFYREKERLLELERKRKAVDSVEATVGRKKVDPMDDFEELLQKKSRPKGVSLYHTSNSRSRSRTRSPSRSYTKSRSRSRSLKKRSRSLARSRSRSPVKSPLRRSRSIVRSRTRSRSRSRPFLRSKSRSRSRYASRKKSFTPKRSFTPVRRYSRSRSRTPLPKRPRSRSFTKSPRPRSRTRSRSPARPLKRISRSLSRSVSRSPLPSKRQPRSRSPASRGRSPPLPPAKRYRRSMSPRGRSMERSHGKPPPRYQPRDSAAHRYSPDRPRSGYKSSPHYDDRGYYRYPDKYDPRWTEYYRMLQDWYAKYDSFAHGLPSGYDNFGRLHSRGLPRSRSRSHSPRPLKRSHSPDDPAKWKRERSPKRMRMDVRDKSRTGRYEKDDARKLSDINRDKERRKDARPAASKSEKERSGAAGVDSDRFQHTPNKSDRRRGEDEDTARSQNHDRDDPRQQPRNKVDARDNRPESGGRKMGSKPLWDDRAEKTESRGRKAVSKPSRDRDNSEPREESSKIPVIGASAAVERRHSIGQNVIGDNQSSVGENLRVVKEEQPKDDKRMIKEEPPCESVKEEQPKEIKQVSNDGHGTKKDKVTRDLMDQEMEHKSKEPEVEWKAKDKETPKPKIEEPVAAAMTTKTRHREIEEPVAAATKTKARHREGSCGSEADRPVQHQSRSNKKLERPAAKEASESRRKLSDLQHAKARMSPSVEDVLYANIPTTSKWEKNQSDSDTEIPQPRWMDQEKERTSNLPRSVLESAENAVRHKPRSSVVSSVCSPPLPRSSIQRISTHSELSQQTKKSVKEKKASKDDKYQDVSLHQGRKVVQGPTSLSMKVTVSSNAKDSKEGKKGEKNSRAAEKYATPPSPVGVREVKRSISGDGRRNKDRDRGERGSTRREDDGKFSRKESHESGVGGNPSASSAKKDEPSKKTSGIRDRKASVFVDEDKFEPDYNESGSSDCEGSVVRATDKGYHNSMSDGRRQESSSEAEEVKAKQKKKHKKHKKLKKHKTKSSRKEDK